MRYAMRMLGAAALLALGACGGEELGGPEEVGTVQSAASKSGGTTGNGSPSGAHYNLNIIGVPKGKEAEMTKVDGSIGGRIFVPLGGRSKILLTEGDDFGVTDANATDGSAAFTCPNPDPDGDGETSYGVFVRALGKPGGGAYMGSCMEVDGAEYCSGDETSYSTTGLGGEYLEVGSRKFADVTRDLLYVYVDLTDDGVDNPGTYPLFGEDTYGYFWEYENHGLKLAQLRFYEYEH